jgi:hypothetical protein
VEIGALQPSLGFKDFRRAARLQSLTNGRFGGEKQAGLRSPPRPQLQGSSSSLLWRRSALGGGLPPRGSVTLFFPRRSGEKGILQPCGGVLQPCGGRRTAAWPGCSFPSFIRAAVVPRAGWPRPGPPRTVSRAGGSPSTSYAVRAVLVFWDGLSEDGSEDLPVRFGAAAVRRRGVGGFDPTNGALRLFSPNGLSSPLVWGRGRGPLHSSVCPEVIATAV